MNPSIEDRLRTSLHERAEDVEPTPHLWRAVQQRLSRRRWALAGTWVGVAAAAAAMVWFALPVMLPGTAIPDIADRPDAPVVEDGAPGESAEPGDPDTSETDAGEPAGDGSDDPTGGDAVESGETVVAQAIGPVLVGAGPDLELRGATGEVLASMTFPEEGGSTVVGVAVRPGSTVEDLTAVILTTAEGMFDLRVVTRDSDRLDVEVVETPPYQPTQDAADLRVSGPVWSPDGTSLAWLEQDDQAARLRTIGWGEGPGTGNPATDNATFELGDASLAPLELADWVATDDPGRFVLRATSVSARDGWYEVQMEQQADGAWALPPDGGVQEVGAPASATGAVHALAGTQTGEEGRTRPLWLVTASDVGPVAIEDPDGEARTRPLPPEVLGEPGEAVVAWARSIDGVLVVGSPSTGAAAALLPGDPTGPVPGPVEWLAPVR